MEIIIKRFHILDHERTEIIKIIFIKRIIDNIIFHSRVFLPIEK